MSQRLTIVRSLTRLKTQTAKVDTLKQLGINIEAVNDDIADLLEECICTMICGDNDTAFESCLTDIQHWLDKTDALREVITMDLDPNTPSVTINVEAVSDFVDFLFETYKK